MIEELKEYTGAIYGVPYQGSKNLIAPFIISTLPKCNVFVDMFCGGGAVSHCAMKVGKAESYIMNDLNSDAMYIYKTALEGGYEHYTDWVDRQTFECSSDPFVRLMWSFNCARVSYLYKKEIEPFKHALHNVIIFCNHSLMESMGIHLPECKYKSLNLRRLFYRRYINNNNEKIHSQYCAWYKNTVLNIGATWRAELSRAEFQKSELCKRFIHVAAKSGYTLAELNRHLDNQMACHYFTNSQWEMPTTEAFARLQEILPDLASISLKEYEAVKSVFARERSRKEIEKKIMMHELENEQRMQRLRKIHEMQKNIEAVHYYAIDYERLYEAEVKKLRTDGRVVLYCDPPYIGKDSKGYSANNNRDGIVFDHERFYAFCERVADEAGEVFISEMSMPEDRFVCLLNIPKRNLFSSKVVYNTEKLFIPRKQYEQHKNEYIQRALCVINTQNTYAVCCTLGKEIQSKERLNNNGQFKISFI
jgi:site-specific DNA-adenine methylase